jgi:hypothetical protein
MTHRDPSLAILAGTLTGLLLVALAALLLASRPASAHHCPAKPGEAVACHQGLLTGTGR